jgi:hypothetical protein
MVFIANPFLFCLNCGVSCGPRQSDYGKLATLSSEGRSSATTILSLSTILHLKDETVSSDTPPKLLSFTDNRQDASLQAGHFNDFVEVGLLRGALYQAALAQARLQSAIILDASRSIKDKRQAEQLRRDAESQLKLLTEAENVVQSDFYSYRYFATEGFLPGYSFPRLPISAYIPARRVRQRDEFLSRPRFLAISEFGPRAIVYHEGSRYIINQVILPVDDGGARTRQAAQCEVCGYLHPITDSDTWYICERCGTPLPPPLQSLLRLQNVVTRRRDRINSDEEERLRLGYDIRTGIRFPEREGYPSHQVAAVMQGEDRLAQLVYAQAATLWRINLGWARRKNKNQHGFMLDIERGYWEKSEQVEEADPEDPM